MNSSIPQILQERVRQIQLANPNRRVAPQKSVEELAQSFQTLITRAQELSRK